MGHLCIISEKNEYLTEYISLNIEEKIIYIIDYQNFNTIYMLFILNDF